MLAAVFDSQTSSASKPTALDVATWVGSAPAWHGYTGEIDAHGVMVHRFGTHDTGKLTLRYNLAADHLTVVGSPHSFRYGHNSGPFSFAEAQATFQQIADALLLPPKAFKLHKLETGITVPVKEAPTAFLAQLSRSHYGPQQAPFYAMEPPAKCSEPLLFAARTNELRVKCYNAGAFAKFKNRPLPPGPSGQAFRFELQYLKSRRLGKALGWDGSITWANLMQADVYEKLAARLLEGWHNVFLPASMDTPHLSIDERALLIAGQYPEFWEAGKRETPPATYRRKRALFRKLQQAQSAQAETGNPYTVDLERQVAATMPTAQK